MAESTAERLAELRRKLNEGMRLVVAVDQATIGSLLDHLDAQAAEIERLRRVLDALRELITLHDEVKHTDPVDYERRKPLAWQAAREALKGVTP